MLHKALAYLFLLIATSVTGYATDMTLYVDSAQVTADLDDVSLVVTYANCRAKDGAIKGLKGEPGMTYQWRDKDNAVVGTAIDLVNISYGVYTLTYKDAAGVTKTYGPLTVYNTNGPRLDESNKVITAGSCADNNGSIRGIVTVSDLPLTYRWVQFPNQEQVGDELDLENVPPGRYRLQISDSNRCDYIRTSIITVPGSGFIDVDATRFVVSNETCGAKNGSIKGFVLKNPDPRQVIQWTDARGNIVGRSLDLINVPAGPYTLTIVYQNGFCPYVYTNVFINNTGGPVIDDSEVKIDFPFCGDKHAAITNLKVTGIGKLTYVWTNYEGKEVGYEKDLLNVGARRYTLKVTDESGCGSAVSKTFTIGNETPGFPFNGSTAIITKGTCTTMASVTGIAESPFLNYFWSDWIGNIISDKLELKNVPGGLYTLNVIAPCPEDSTKIQSNFYKYDLGIASTIFKPFQVDITKTCVNQSNGTITVNSDYTVRGIRWVNGNNQNVGNAKKAEGLAAGTYQLYLSNDDCESYYGTYVVEAVSPPPPPKAPDVQFCAGDGVIRIAGTIPGNTYRLYDDADSATPLDEQESGVFEIKATKSRSYYISQVSGPCESTRNIVNIQIGLAPTDITNMLTPNGDGINDYWKIYNIEKYPKAFVQLFDRNGVRVYQNRGYTRPFDGTYSDKALPTGIYYYIIALTDTCNVSGNITLIR